MLNIFTTEIAKREGTDRVCTRIGKEVANVLTGSQRALC